MLKLLEKTTATPVWMRAPQWRWNIALASRSSPLTPLGSLRSDCSLYEGATFYRHLCRQRQDYGYRRRVYPEMTMAYSIWAGANPLGALDDTCGRGGWRRVVEALLLAGLPFDSFRSALGVDLPADVVHLYHDAFFDVHEYLASAPAIWINVLGASDQTLPDMHHADSGMMMRLFAYTWGPDALLESFYSKRKGVNKMHDRWLKTLVNDIITRQAVGMAMDRRNFFKEDCREVFELARKHWQMPEQEVSSVEDEMRKKFLYETVTLLDDRLKRADVLRAEKELTAKEALEAVEIGTQKAPQIQA